MTYTNQQNKLITDRKYINHLGGETLKEVIDSLTELGEQYGYDTLLDVEVTEYSAEFSLIIERIETDEEVLARLAAEKRYNEHLLDKRRKLYEQMKKEFE